MARSNTVRFRKYLVSQYQKEALAFLRPPEDITVSQWAEKYRILDAKSSASPGPWRNDRTPYLVDIMDEFCNFETEEIVFVKPTQVGGTEALQNMISWAIHEDPAPAMIVYPTDSLSESISENRIQPMLRLSPPLKERWRENDSTKQELQFENMYLTLVGSNSPSGLASRPIKYLFLDEVDKFPGSSKKESDPLSLARERTKTFRNKKIYLASTPTLRTGHIWKAMEEADAVKHFFVPCPHCGKFIELKWAQVSFPQDENMTYADRAELATYICQECGCIIADQHKQQMLRYGQWRTVRQSAQIVKKVAFWINTLYSPFVRFSQVVKEFLKSKDEPDKLQNFVNSWLAEPWEDTKLKTNADLVLERQTDLPAYTVPDWAKLLTGGVDVQENCLYWTIRAWGNYLTSQNIAHGQAWSFAEIERVMNLAFKQPDGTQMVVALSLIDSGDQTDAVYDFCADNSDWALPCKGSSNPMMSHFKLSKVNKTDSKAYGMQLVLVDGGKYKDMVAGRMRKENGTGSWMVYKGCDREYAEQVTAEHKVNVKSGQRTRQEWTLKTSHADNHYLDAEVYCFCAADLLGARTMHLEEETVKGREEPPKQEEPPTPEENWIGTNESWL